MTKTFRFQRYDVVESPDNGYTACGSSRTAAYELLRDNSENPEIISQLQPLVRAELNQAPFRAYLLAEHAIGQAADLNTDAQKDRASVNPDIIRHFLAYEMIQEAREPKVRILQALAHLRRTGLRLWTIAGHDSSRVTVFAPNPAAGYTPQHIPDGCAECIDLLCIHNAAAGTTRFDRLTIEGLLPPSLPIPAARLERSEAIEIPIMTRRGLCGLFTTWHTKTETISPSTSAAKIQQWKNELQQAWGELKDRSDMSATTSALIGVFIGVALSLIQIIKLLEGENKALKYASLIAPIVFTALNLVFSHYAENRTKRKETVRYGLGKLGVALPSPSTSPAKIDIEAGRPNLTALGARGAG